MTTKVACGMRGAEDHHKFCFRRWGERGGGRVGWSVRGRTLCRWQGQKGIGTYASHKGHPLDKSIRCVRLCYRPFATRVQNLPRRRRTKQSHLVEGEEGGCSTPFVLATRIPARRPHPLIQSHMPSSHIHQEPHLVADSFITRPLPHPVPSRTHPKFTGRAFASLAPKLAPPSPGRRTPHSRAQ
jgi:hypothetical protein